MSELIELVKIEQDYPEYTMIILDAWIDRIFEDCKVELPEKLDAEIDGGWAIEHEAQIIDWISKTEGQEYETKVRDNTFNSPNDLSNDFVYQVIGPVDGSCGDWCWDDDTYVIIERHNGGDPRNNNYSQFEIYKVDSLADTGFFDMSVGWTAHDLDGDYADVQEIETGYSNEPFCQIRDHYISRKWDPIMRWSAKHNGFLARNVEAGRTHVLTPYCQAEWR